MVTMGERFQYVYGPVSSWRVGSFLGVDVLSQKEKICSYNCVYCQLGRTGTLAVERQIYVSGKTFKTQEVKNVTDERPSASG